MEPGLLPTQLYNYDPRKVHVAIVGAVAVIPKVTGFAPGSSIRITAAAPAYFRIDGIRGQVARARAGLLAGTIGFVLEERSHVNALLQTVAAADRAAGSGIVSVGVFDEHGLDIAVAPMAWIMGRPEWIKGAQAGTKTWLFDTDRLEMVNLGGIPR